MAYYIITTLISGRKKLITAFTKRFDNSLIPEYSETEQNAKVFTTRIDAQEAIKKIHNTHDRIFLIETYKPINKPFNHPKTDLQ